MNIEMKVHKTSSFCIFWTFVYEEEGKDVELEKMGAEQSKEIASRAEGIKRQVLVSSQIQDPLEEVNLGEGSAQQPTYISAWLSALDRDQLLMVLLMVLKRYKACLKEPKNFLPDLLNHFRTHLSWLLLVWLEIRLHKEPMFH